MAKDVSVIDFGTKVRTRRIQLGIMQQACADALGISRPSWIKIEQGNRNTLPSIEQIEVIAKLFRMDADSLMGASDTILEFYTEEEREQLKNPESIAYVKMALAQMYKAKVDAEAASNLKLRQDIYYGRA